MARSDIFNLISGYERRKSRTSPKSFYTKRISGAVTQRTKHFRQMQPIKLFRSIIDLFSYGTAKTYGILLLCFGLLSLIVQLCKDYFEIYGGLSLSAMIIGALFAAVSIPLLLVDEPVSVMLQRFKLTEIIFFEFFCIKRPFYTGNEKALHPVLAAFIGVFLALLGIFVPLWCVALGIGIAVFLFISFLSPEFCFFFSLLSLPYLSLIPNYTGILSAVAVIGALSFIRKTVFGKRVICIEQYDLVLGLFVLLILVGSFINMTADSIIVGMSMAFMALGYFLSSNVVTNRRLADCAVNAVVISALPAALVSLTAFFIDAYGGRAGAFLEEGISSTFSSPVAASAYFTEATIFSLTLAKESKGGVRGVYSAFLVLSLTGLVLTGRLFSLFALLITIAAYYSLKSGAWLALFLPILFLIPYMFLLLPEAFLSALPSAAYTDGSVATFKSALGAFLDNPVFGIGIGTDSFSQKMADYGVSGFENSGNLFLELGLGSGALLLAVFILLLVVRLIHRAYYQRYVRKSQLSKLSPLASVALMALLVLGCFDYIFSDLSILYLFFAVFGIGGASLRVCKRDYDDRTLYFEHEKSSTSSVISVYIK